MTLHKRFLAKLVLFTDRCPQVDYLIYCKRFKFQPSLKTLEESEHGNSSKREKARERGRWKESYCKLNPRWLGRWRNWRIFRKLLFLGWLRWRWQIELESFHQGSTMTLQVLDTYKASDFISAQWGFNSCQEQQLKFVWCPRWASKVRL